MAVLEVADLDVTLATGQGPLQVLRQVNLALPPGGTLGIAGESGSGKSMLALAVMGLLPDGASLSGSIRLEGRELIGLGDAGWCKLRGKDLAMIFQEPMTALNPLHMIGDQIAETLRLHENLPRSPALARAVQWLAQVGLDFPAQRAQSYPHQLSGGQRQRVMMAMALACQPKLLMADEPTTALDATTQAQVLALLARLVDDKKLALILISHDLAVLARYVTQVAVMYAGQIVECGPASKVLAYPAHPYTKGLLAARPRLGGGRLVAMPGAAPVPGKWPAGCSFAPRCSWVLPACTQASVAMQGVAPGHEARCLRASEALE